MNTSEAMIGTEVTKAQVIRELKKHGYSFDEFKAGMGDEPTYDSLEVMVWMGY